MKILIMSFFLLCISVRGQTITQNFGSGDQSFSLEFVTIGNPGNEADTTGVPNPAGSVGYIYNIGKYEVSRDMITKANEAGSLGITLADLTRYGGNGPNRPATGISWNEAARFVNYLNTIKGYQVAYNFTTSGANDNITLWGAGQYSGGNQFRHKDAYYFLPSMDEWYKAAYGSPIGTWYNYPNGSDGTPGAVASGTSGAVYNQLYATGPADIANAGGLSAYGTMAQGGNVWEWTESAYDGRNDYSNEWRVLRGSNWFLSETNILGASGNGVDGPSVEDYSVGFRVASVPEPSSLSLLALSTAVLMAGRRRESD